MQTLWRCKLPNAFLILLCLIGVSLSLRPPPWRLRALAFSSRTLAGRARLTRTTESSLHLGCMSQIQWIKWYQSPRVDGILNTVHPRAAFRILSSLFDAGTPLWLHAMPRQRAAAAPALCCLPLLSPFPLERGQLVWHSSFALYRS